MTAMNEHLLLSCLTGGLFNRRLAKNTKKELKMSTTVYTGLWNQGTGPEYYISTSDLSVFSKTQQDLFGKGNLLTALQVNTVNGQVVYSATAHAGSGTQGVLAATEETAFTKWIDDQVKNGLRLTAMSATVLNGKILYAGVVHAGTGAEWVLLGKDLATFQKWVQDMFGKGFRLTSLSTCVLNGQVLYSGAVQPGTVAEWWHAAADAKTFFTWSTGLFNKGFRMTSFTTCVLGDQILYAGAMHPGSGAQFTSAPLAWADFNALETKMLAKGFRINALLACEILPDSRTWQIAPFSCGKVDFNGGSVIARADGTWSFYGSVHDNSFWYGDDWAMGFVFGNTSHGALVKGILGAEISGPAVDGTFKKSGKDPWIHQNWEAVFGSGVNYTMNVDGDLDQLFGAIVTDLEKYGSTIIQLVETVAAAA
jgi:hypothetical protein